MLGAAGAEASLNSQPQLTFASSHVLATPPHSPPPPPPCPQVWDLRREEISMSLAGHSDSITGMRLSPDGTHLLTNSMDNTLR